MDGNRRMKGWERERESRWDLPSWRTSTRRRGKSNHIPHLYISDFKFSKYFQILFESLSQHCKVVRTGIIPIPIFPKQMEAQIQITQTTYSKWHSYLNLRLKSKSPDLWPKALSPMPEEEREEKGTVRLMRGWYIGWGENEGSSSKRSPTLFETDPQGLCLWVAGLTGGCETSSWFRSNTDSWLMIPGFQWH